MKFAPKKWCETQINLARIEIQLKYFVEDKADLNELWDGVMVGYSFRENADRAAQAQAHSLIEIHKIIPNFFNNEENNSINGNENKIDKESSALEYINYEISNILVNEFKKLTKTNKSAIIEHLKDNFYSISILSETIKSENELENLVKEKIKNHSN